MPNILRNLRIDRVASVDKGAGEGVHVVLVKRTEPKTGLDEKAIEAYLKREFSEDKRKELASSGKALPDGSFPIENKGDLANAVQAFGRAKDKGKARKHIIARARSLGAVDSLPDSWNVKKALLKNDEGAIDFDEAMAADDLQEMIDGIWCCIDEASEALCDSFCSIMCDPEAGDQDARQKLVGQSFEQFKTHLQGIVPDEMEKALRRAGLGTAQKEPTMPDDLAKKIEDLEKKLADLVKENTILKMSDKHKKYMSDMGMSDDQKDKFSSKTPEERDAHMEKHPFEKEVEKHLPESIRMALAKAAEDSVKLAELLKKDETESFKKRATAIGMPEAFGETLMKMSRGDAEACALVEKTLKGLIEQIGTSKMFDEFGKGNVGNAGGTAGDTLKSLAEAYQADQEKVGKKLSYAQAFAHIYTHPANAELAKRDKIESLNKRRAA